MAPSLLRTLPFSALLCGLMLLAALASHRLAPHSDQAGSTTIGLASLAPTHFGAWRTDANSLSVMPIVQENNAIAGAYDEVIHRTYVNHQGTRIMLVLAYGSRQMGATRSHRQELCYRSQGASIEGLQRGAIALAGQHLPVMRMHTVFDTRSEPVTYWFTMGRRTAVTPLELLIAQLRVGLAGQVPDGLLIRVSSLSRDPGKAFTLHDAFVRAWLAALKPTQRWRIAGERA